MKKPLFIICILINTMLQAQQSVIATAGSNFVNGNSQISWTIGEIITETNSNSNVVLTQGFHQSVYSFVEIMSLKDDLSIKIFPNPAIENITLSLPKIMDITCVITDSNGKMILSKQLITQKTTLSVNEYAKGTYFLSFYDTENQQLKSIQFIKQ